MKCRGCNTELERESAYGDKRFSKYVCPICRKQYIYDTNNNKFYAYNKNIFLLIIAIAFLFCFPLITSNITNANSFLVFVSSVITVLALVAAVWCIKTKKKYLGYTVAGVYTVYWILLVCALNNIPEFIRAIKGKDFLNLYSTVFFVVVLLTIVIYCVTFFVTLRITKKHFVASNISDYDIMISRNYDNDKIMGYYILKAKLMDVVKITEVREKNSLCVT